MFTFNPGPAYTFPPSEAANLEYSILSTILGGSPESAGSAASPPIGQTPGQQANGSYVAQSSTNVISGTWPTPASSFTTTTTSLAAVQPSDTTLPSTAAATATNGYAVQYSQQSSQASPSTNGTTSAQSQYNDFSNQTQQSSSLANYAGQAPSPLNHVSPVAVQLAPTQAVIAPTRSSSASLMDRTVSAGTASWAGPTPSDLGLLDGTSVYKSVTKPYDYTQGYHFLMKHLPTRCVHAVCV